MSENATTNNRKQESERDRQREREKTKEKKKMAQGHGARTQARSYLVVRGLGVERIKRDYK